MLPVLFVIKYNILIFNPTQANILSFYVSSSIEKAWNIYAGFSAIIPATWEVKTGGS